MKHPEADRVKKQVKTNGGRKVHITLPVETHQRLRIRCAVEDVTIQEFVARLIESSVEDFSVVQKRVKTEAKDA